MVKKLSTVEGKIENVLLAELQIDPSYQREEKQNRKKIKNEFDPSAVGVLHVGRRRDGSLWLIDGQQRVWAMKDLGIEKWKAFVIHSSGSQYEAAVFKMINGSNRMRLSAQDLFRAGLQAQDPVCMAVQRAVESARLTIRTTNGRSGTQTGIACVGTLCNMVVKGGEDLLTRVLSVLVRTWPMQDSALRELIPAAMGKLFYAQGDKIDDERFIEKLSIVPPIKILNDSASGLGDRATNAQSIMARYYNKNIQTKSKRLTVFSRDDVDDETEDKKAV